MKFCEVCGSIMKKTTVVAGAGGDIIFKCRCQITVQGDADDTLMMEGFTESNTIGSRQEVFIENSAFDPAANIVLVDCPECGMDFMTLIFAGVDQVTMYTCRCGYQITRKEHQALAQQSLS